MLIILNLPLIGMWIKLLTVPYRCLFPAIVLFCAIGVYSTNNNTFDIWMVAIFGFLGYLFIKLGCEPAPLLLGFILGPMMEENLRRALLLSRGDWSVFVTRPLSAGLLAAALLLLVIVLLPPSRPSAKKPSSRSELALRCPATAPSGAVFFERCRRRGTAKSSACNGSQFHSRAACRPGRGRARLRAAHGAQGYPTKPIRLVVPFPAGGATDLFARTLSQKMGEKLGATRGGRQQAGRRRCHRLRHRRPRRAPDGYTLLLATTSTHSIGPAITPQAALRHGARLHADRARRRCAQHHAGAEQLAGQDGERMDRLREEEPRQAQLRLAAATAPSCSSRPSSSRRRPASSSRTSRTRARRSRCPT